MRHLGLGKMSPIAGDNLNVSARGMLGRSSWSSLAFITKVFKGNTSTSKGNKYCVINLFQPQEPFSEVSSSREVCTFTKSAVQ